MLLNNEWVKNEIREETKKVQETNKNDLTTVQMNKLTLYLQELEEQQ